ncbi:MAG: DUF58 domain-containing protein [Clostridia bacterium]|nr:DUF58 domain-containing protein [Clostridia bacterium]
MKQRKKKRRAFAVTPYFLIWVLLFVVALVFSQTMPNSISAVFLVVISALPFIELIYILTGKAAVRAYLQCDTERAEKKSTVNYSLSVDNRSPLPFPFVEAEFILPDEVRLSCVDHDCVLSLLPFGKYADDRRMVFIYRGYYVIGIKSVYIYDLLKFFRIRISGVNEADVFIVPRRLDLGFGTERGATDAPSARTEAAGYDRSEQTDIKEYAAGDPMKNIHWKLSGKTQSLMVKKFGSETGRSTYVFTDMCARFDTDDMSGNREDINEYCVDAAVEVACSYVTAHLHRDESVNVIFHDCRANFGGANRVNRTCCESLADFEDLFDYFSATPIAPDLPLSSLAAGIEDKFGTFVFILSYLTDQVVETLCECSGRAGRTEVIVCEPFAKIYRPDDLKKAYKGYIETLAENGIAVRSVSASEIN